MSYESKCSEILDLFRAAGKEIPHEDSNMGRAVQILQTICDSQSHTIPDAKECAKDLAEHLKSEHDWTFFPGNAAANPYLEKGPSHFEGEVIEIAHKAASEEGEEDYIASEIFEALEEIETKLHDGDDDFTLDFDGNEYRLIKESDIWDIYVEEIKNTVKECYSDVINLDKIPSFIAVSIDWEQTAKNAYADGYGHQFSGYDGSEEEAAGYYIFRTN